MPWPYFPGSYRSTSPAWHLAVNARPVGLGGGRQSLLKEFPEAHVVPLRDRARFEKVGARVRNSASPDNTESRETNG